MERQEIVKQIIEYGRENEVPITLVDYLIIQHYKVEAAKEAIDEFAINGFYKASDSSQWGEPKPEVE